MKILINLIISALVVILGAYLIPGIEVSGFFTALIVAIVMAVINTIIRPILVVLTIPITFFTLGLFLLVINAAMVKLAGILIPGFIVDGFWAALILGLILSIFNGIRGKD
jgi:putative membrane protein